AAAQAERDASVVQIRTLRARMRAIEVELRRLEPQLGDRLGSGLDAELETAQQRVQTLVARLDAYYQENPELRGADERPAFVASLEQELARARGRVQQISDRLARESLEAAGAPGDPSAGFVRASGLRAQLADLRVEVQGLEAQRDQLASRLSQYEAELARIPRQSMELAQLQRDRLATEALAGALVTNLQEARVAEQSQLGYAKPIRPAFETDEPVAPKRLRNVFLAMVLGLFLGSALAIAKVRLDHRIHRPDDIRDRGHSLIGTVPDTTDLIERDFEGQDTVHIDGREIDSRVITLLNPMAAASEAYRALRTSVQFSRPDVMVQTVVITSSNPAEGKSTTAANLAVVMAQAGRRTLLVDADLRKPTGHKKFGVPREPGLVQLLFDDAPLQLSHLTEVADDLWMLPAGALAPNPSELLGSKRMRDVLAEMRELFDVIILDAPPVLAATDPVLLSTQVDATLVVTRAGITKDYDLTATMDALREVGASVIGTVLNGFDVANAYGYRYKYAYRYGSDYAYGSDVA
ncbi:MAG: polysaccharide biosynthesis tyrosine autokinase, partial [Bacteroidota bacterium]